MYRLRTVFDELAGGHVDAAATTVNAMLAEANGIYLLSGDPAVFAMARRAIDDRLERAQAAPSAQA